MSALWIFVSVFLFAVFLDLLRHRSQKPPWRISLITAIFAGGWLSSRLAGMENEDVEKNGPSGTELSTNPFSPRPRPGQKELSSAVSLPNAASLSPQSPLRRPFAKGEAVAWLRSLGELDDLDDELERWEMMARLSALDKEDLAELNGLILKELSENPERQMARTAARLRFLVCNQWSLLDPAAAFENLLSLPQDNIEDHTARLLFQRYSADHPDEALAAIGKLPESARQQAGRGIMDQAARRDPFAALELIPRLGKYASSDPRGIVDLAIARDPLRTVTMAGPISGDAPRDNTFLRGMEGWMKLDPAAAEAWMQNYQGPGRTTGLTAVISAKTESDPAAAAAAFAKLPDAASNPYTQGLAEKITQALLKQQGPEATLSWSSQLPSGGQRNMVVTRTIAVWAGTDGEAASRWVDQQTPGAERDSAVLGLVNGVRRSDPAAAWEWARTLTDSAQQIRLLPELHAELTRHNPASAAAAWEALPESLRNQLSKDR